MYNSERTCGIQTATLFNYRALAMPLDDVIDRTIEIARRATDQDFADVGMDAICDN
jgi:hypothetical protein